MSKFGRLAAAAAMSTVLALGAPTIASSATPVESAEGDFWIQSGEITPFEHEWSFGSTDGHIQWWNRSVTISGSVWDAPNGSSYTQVLFSSWSGSTLVSEQTRTVSGGTTGKIRDFQFDVTEASHIVGGVTKINIYLRAEGVTNVVATCIRYRCD